MKTTLFTDNGGVGKEPLAKVGDTDARRQGFLLTPERGSLNKTGRKKSRILAGGNN